MTDHLIRWNGEEWVSHISLLDMSKMAHEDSKRWFPEVADSLQYHVLAMCGEAGEVANALKKGLRGTFDHQEALDNAANETIDVFVYLLNIWAILDIDPEAKLREINTANEARFGGSNDCG